MRYRLFLYSLISLPILFIACSGSSQKKQPQNVAKQPTLEPRGKTLVYDCLVEWDMVVKVDTSDAWLFLPDTTVHMSRERSASGARFASGSGDYMYWSKGNEAIIEVADKSYGYCDLDKQEAVWQDAKLRGANFRAAGNEPGWYLEIFPDSITYVLDYGERSFSTSTPDSTEYTDKKEFVYEVQTENYQISIRITGEECNSASGKEFPSTTYLTVGEKEYRGCGRKLE